ncbi:MAG: Asp-tRNA(Asn)/Glu-tRNA(Gln) amidotransferase subunit GatB [Candidatus Omnitrophota bacterium]|nr:Asp-tRNA(Asn)/Glu-tRNA(Gln) amidotransferase subunit GatB [Candidatus Omnitrophota bacterium]
MYETVIGLEVHAQLKTRTKAFCGCLNEFGAPANTRTCPVCLGFPGSLPVLNEMAFEHGMKAALALNCQIQNFTKFDRKHYFYPDLPKNYQISQYDLPLALDGGLKIKIKDREKTIPVKRVHLEEDAGKLIHEGEGSLVDYNRAGVPLLEIVTEPEIHSPDEAYEYLSELKAILKYLEVSDCDMEKGSLRCDANISLRLIGAEKLGTKTELKNMNSFKAVREALNYEIKRQTGILESGQRIIQETLLWDEVSAKTVAMRSKEEAMDYRYFTEPDLPGFVLTEEKIKAVKDNLPELPQALKQRFIRDYGLSDYDVEILAQEKRVADYFEACFKIYPQAKSISNWLIGPLSYELNSRNLDIQSLGLKPPELTTLISFVDQDKISNLSAKEVLTARLNSKKTVEEIIQEKDLLQICDSGELSAIIDAVISANQKSVQDYSSGKANALMFLVGQVMRQSKGKANPKVAQEMLKEKLTNV